MNDPDPSGAVARSTERDVLELLSQMVEILLASSYEGTGNCEAYVADAAAAYGHKVQVTFFADAAVFTLGDTTRSFTARPDVPPLDEVARFKRIMADVLGGRLTAAEARERFAAAWTRPPRWGRPWKVLGLVLFSVGFGVSVQATWQQVAVSAVMGLLVGLLVALTQGRLRMTLLAPLLGSTLVSAAVLALDGHGLIDGGPIQLIVPALFYFIPGDALAAAMIELVDGRITAGATRMVYSLALLTSLAFGTVVAMFALGVPEDALFDTPVPGNLPQWAVWAGWVLFALGVMWTFSMDWRDFPWALGLVLLTAAVVQIGVRVVGDPIATFAAAAVMTAVALRLGRRPGLPPAYVLYLGAFYVLTPGSHGLRGLESWIGGNREQGVADLAGMAGLLVAISLGMLVGAVAGAPRDRGRLAI